MAATLGSRKRKIDRTVRMTVFLIGVLVLISSVVTSVLAVRRGRVDAQDHALDVTLGRQVEALQNYFERARAIDAVLADNPVFSDYYAAPATPAKLRRVNEALGYLETLFPGRIGEACFIDSSGTEIARVVDSTPAGPDDLSRDEDDNAFFAPTLALEPGQVYQAKEYESTDTHNAVISNSTTVRAAGHTGIVHFEIALDSFRMAGTTGSIAASIVDAQTGHVLVDTRTGSIPAALPPGAGDHGVTTLGGRRIAYQRIHATRGNANDWYLAVSAPAFGRGWTHGLSIGSLALLLGALLIILISAVSGWRYLTAVRRSATYDRLTGLPNRTLLADRLGAALDGGQRAAVLLFDLQGFKDVNDLLGTRHGDLLLTQVARRLSAAVPSGALLARVGADDFAVLLPGGDLAGAHRVADDLLQVLRPAFTLGDVSLDVEVSAGIAAGPGHGDDAETLLRHAGSALQLATEQATGVHEYEPGQDADPAHRLQLLADLRRALDTDDQLTVHYQPKIELDGERVAGVEALIRWEHPDRGRIPPDSFIPIAETTSLIHPLTTRVLEIAVRQAAAWRRDGRLLPVAVNLSTRCLLNPSFPDQIFQLLRSYDVPAAVLELEVTESLVMTDPERCLAVLHALHAGGIRLSVDDFGTGHSSMSYLQRLPVDELKIDKSFVQGMATSHGDAVLVRTAVSLGHNLGLSVVAEGVEDATAVAALRELGCDIAQGYHYARPMPAADFDRWHAAFLGKQAADLQVAQ
ncbi:signal peptide protein [Actinoplanes sp. SE50]|uniref:putative bifunctional diguanylate cyclase/phosphodiesterase n=1 Tax=unclassified Actinoplanes TaxID=2626549 RepID=UPI00023EC116|nr:MULTISPECIES: bifunctional diguanylate cyclase/phosphodiesterase [unclassified Actinoplanes]AEV85770.1 putative signaling protein [Actinoplanes sp. SE50/110]ATO84163.1 signal peptide protein [Actinoplanes sp. SE50]SLM01573.1 hypothetical protein ACSP50_4809 [Actinoplanes sp. SE50/110]